MANTRQELCCFWCLDNNKELILLYVQFDNKVILNKLVINKSLWMLFSMDEWRWCALLFYSSRFTSLQIGFKIIFASSLKLHTIVSQWESHNGSKSAQFIIMNVFFFFLLLLFSHSPFLFLQSILMNSLLIQWRVQLEINCLMIKNSFTSWKNICLITIWWRRWWYF